MGIGHTIATGFIRQNHLDLLALLPAPPLLIPFFREIECQVFIIDRQ
jgi:hypothetical protein